MVIFKEIIGSTAKILDKLSYETFIPKEILTPAGDLLCFGLGIAVQTTNQPSTPSQQQVQPPTTSVSSTNDFEIENGVLKKYIGKGGVVTIPNTVTKIGNKAFMECKKLTQVIIPDTVTEIEWCAFAYCKNLTEITLPNSIDELGNAVFLECKNLTQAIISNSITEIPQEAFTNCKNLIQITIPNSVTEIGISAFSGCISLTKISLPNTITEIGSLAFIQCKSLPIATIEQIKKISPRAFN